MRYILNPNIALRSWQLVPYAYYIKGERNAKGLKKDEFGFLSACDGKTVLPSGEDSDLARRFLANGMMEQAACLQKPLFSGDESDDNRQMQL